MSNSANGMAKYISTCCKEGDRVRLYVGTQVLLVKSVIIDEVDFPGIIICTTAAGKEVAVHPSSIDVAFQVEDD